MSINQGRQMRHTDAVGGTEHPSVTLMPVDMTKNKVPFYIVTSGKAL